MTPLLVVNPKAGGGKQAPFAEIRGPIERKLGTVDVVFTEHVGHAAELSEKAASEGRELVIAVGGDGTFSDVANGVIRSAAKTTAVGLIGQGTGGDFRKTLGIEHRLDKYLEAIASGRERPIDVGRATFAGNEGKTTHYFVNILSAGMGGLVDEYVGKGSRLLGGTAAYFLASTKALIRTQRARLRCIVDGKPLNLDSYMIAICNGRYFGSGMHVAPMALPDDGKLEVVSMDAPSKVAFAAFSRKIYDGSHLRSANVQHVTCERIEIDLDPSSERARETFRLDVDHRAGSVVHWSGNADAPAPFADLTVEEVDGWRAAALDGSEHRASHAAVAEADREKHRVLRDE
jgi:diacylglycerol kinase (ATP)